MMRILLLLLFILLGSSVINAAPIYKTKAGIAINGYDPIGYFEQSEPVKGSGAHALVHDGATWLFSSAENLAKFSEDPDRYKPKYGGHCAYAMSRDKGYLATTVPDAWSIVDGVLYLNYSLGVKDKWDKQQKKFISAANDNWPNHEKN